MTIGIVSGAGRSGTSLVMRMLHAGGMEVVADEGRTFEQDECNHHRWPPEEDFWRRCEGRVVKVLDPADGCRLPKRGEWEVIYCKRQTREQAKSALKLLAHMRIPAPPDASVRALAHSLRRARRADLVALAQHPGVRSLVPIAFESILANPTASAMELATWARRRFGRRLDVDRMAACVVTDRTPKCYPGMLELFLPDALEKEKTTC